MGNFNEVTASWGFDTSGDYTKYNTIVDNSYAQLSSSISQSVGDGGQTVTGITHKKVGAGGAYIDNTPNLPALAMA